jgi:hypothetical protein
MFRFFIMKTTKEVKEDVQIGAHIVFMYWKNTTF